MVHGSGLQLVPEIAAVTEMWVGVVEYCGWRPSCPIDGKYPDDFDTAAGTVARQAGAHNYRLRGKRNSTLAVAATEAVIPMLTDQNLCAQSRSPMDMMVHG